MPTEKALLGEHISVDESLIDLFDRHQRGAFSIAYRILRNREDADDAVHDAVVSVLRYRDQFSSWERPGAYFYRVVRNASLAKRRIRAEIRKHEVSLDDEDAAFEIPSWLALAMHECRVVVETFIEQCEDLDRTILGLRLSGETIRDICATVGMPRATVHWRLFRLFKELRLTLRHHG